VQTIVTKPIPRRMKLSRDARTNLAGYMFILPWIIGFILLTLGPMIFSAVLSFFDYGYITDMKFLGFDNYKNLFTKDYFFKDILVVTFKYVLIRQPLLLTIALLFAMGLNKLVRFSDFYRILLYVPSIIGGGVAVAVMWKLFLKYDGIANNILAIVGLGPIKFLSDPSIALFSLMFTSLWAYPGAMIIFLAGLKNIPETFYEAASIDGAGAFRKFLNITVPMLSPVIFFQLVMGIIGGFQTFTSAMIMTNGGPAGATTFYMLHLYRTAFEYHKAGYASAMAWILFFIIMIFTLVIFKTSSLWVFYESDVENKKGKKNKKVRAKHA